MYTRAALALVAFVSALMPYQAQAQEVVLNPGYISGTIAVTGETVNQAYVSASWTDPVTGTNYSASTSVSGGGSYTLTVNVPSGATPSYTVYASLYLNNYQFYITPPSQTVAVTAFNTTTADIVINPGYIEATVNPTSGSLSSLGFYAYGNGTSVNASGSGASLTFPVAPSDSLTVYGYAYFSGGGYASLDQQTVSVGAGQTVALVWTATPPPPPEQGTLSGTFTFNGATPDQTSIQASCGSYGSTSVFGNGSFTIPNLNTGGCYLYAYSYFNNYGNYLYLPDASFSPNRQPTITAGATTTVNISAAAAFMTGKVKLTGTKSLSQASSASLNAYGASSTNAQGASAGTSLNLQTGDYSLVLTEGGWSPASLNLSFYNSDPSAYLSESLNYFDSQLYANPIALSEGQSVITNLTLGMGTVTVNFSVLGGGTLSYPSLYGNCYNQALNTSYSFSAGGNQTNVTTGSVTFVGMAGTCSIEAYAQVGGSSTKFGTLSVEVVPGTDVVIDIGGPSLTVTFPAAGSITSDASIIVSGSAMDDVAVTEVTVNGTAATLTPAGPATPVNFSAPLALNWGPNQIVTVATDSSGKVSSDTRTVYRDQGPPTINWTPADQSSSNVAGVTIQGTASDDVGVASVTVNGVVIFESSDPNSGPTDQPFSLPFTLALGDNFIEVVATDIAGQTTAQTHKVNFNPVAEKADTTTVVSSSPNPSSQGQLVTLTATVSVVAPGSGVPDGTVTFNDGATVLATVPVSGSGEAVFQTSSLALGPHSVTATYNGSSNYAGSATAANHLVFAFAEGGGAFVIGDLNAIAGDKVTYWGAQWAKLNSLSGGASPASFKGFASAASPTVGGTWQSGPGNSSSPPASVPSYLGVIVSSTNSKSGSTISGNVVAIAIVRTDSGYTANPGNAGTGTVVAVIQ